MGQVLAKYKEAGVTSVVFGDIFLEDLRKYREEKLATLDMQGIFPIWGRDTHELAHFSQHWVSKRLPHALIPRRLAVSLLGEKLTSNSCPNCLQRLMLAARMGSIILLYTMDQFSENA
jgi:diphthamide synthase (EF-2-diphthine--ammonia ligase)